MGQKGWKTLGGETRIRSVDSGSVGGKGRLLHDAMLSLEQLKRVIVHVPANPVKIVEAKIETKGGK